MLYPRGICLFPPLPPIPSFLAYTQALHLKSRADGSGWGEWGKKRRGPSARFARLFSALLLDQKTWSQASTKRERPAISLDST